MNKQHFDAVGHPVHDWFDLKRIITHPESLSLLRRHMLFQVIVHPFCEIRIYKNDPCNAVLIHYGCGSRVDRQLVLQERQVTALRRLYRKRGTTGWKIDEQTSFVSFKRDARVTLDPLRRWRGV